jgi:AraC-like DNA-binding protein
LAEDAPQVIANPAAAHGLEQSLVEAMVGCLSEATVREEHWAQQCHATIMRRFRRLLEDNPNQPLYVPEICAAIGVPDRTLRLCCQEHLAMSPKQYLLLRRMHLAHRALCAGTPAETTVTEVATQFGFYHFGRFATVYRAAFGVPPSATLNRPAD